MRAGAAHWHGPVQHLSGLGPHGYQSLARPSGAVAKATLDWEKWPPGMERFEIQPKVNARPF
jgi:hypothetical protein